RLHCGRVLVLHHYKARFLSHASRIDFDRQDGDLSIPDELHEEGVDRIYTRNGVLYYQLTKGMPDEAFEVIIFPPRLTANPVIQLLNEPPHSFTYHIQYLQTPCWYYWQYN